MARILFWLGRAPETWDPLTALDTGIGGAETAAIYLTSELAGWGHEVIAYADVPSVLRNHDCGGRGVTWIPYERLKTDVFVGGRCDCDVFVSSRDLDAVLLQVPFKISVLWVHDLHVGPDWHNRTSLYDKIVCLSHFAKTRFLEYYRSVAGNDVEVISNGIDPGLFDGNYLPVPGRQHADLAHGLRVIYSSSPDRGLSRLLDVWPDLCRELRLKIRHSGIELHVYYGFGTWEKMLRLHGKPLEVRHMEELKRVVGVGADGDRQPNLPTEFNLACSADPEIDARSRGIFFHGRVGKRELAEAFLSSHLWLYPTDFLETSCITAMEASAAGCKIVATRLGALPETVPGARFVDPPTHRDGYADEFVRAVIETVEKPVVSFGAKKSWNDVGGQWDTLIRRALAGSGG